MRLLECRVCVFRRVCAPKTRVCGACVRSVVLHARVQCVRRGRGYDS